MAQQIKFMPNADPTVSAHEELEELLETLHESGTLRVLNGFFGKIADVSEVAMQELASDEGQHTLANGALLLMAFARIPPEELQALLTGIERGLGAARSALKSDAPNMLQLFRLLNDSATRRGLGAALLLLNHIGRDVPLKLKEKN